MAIELFNRIVTLTPPLLIETEWLNGAFHLHLGINTRFIHIEKAKPTP